jgi:hypothetical protein
MGSHFQKNGWILSFKNRPPAGVTLENSPHIFFLNFTVDCFVIVTMMETEE